MKCKCGGKVQCRDSRVVDAAHYQRRRHYKCDKCNVRFVTMEYPVDVLAEVVKKAGEHDELVKSRTMIEMIRGLLE